MKVGRVHYPVISSEQIPRSGSRLTYRHKSKELPIRPARSDTLTLTKKHHSAERNPLVKRASSQLRGYFDRGGKGLPDRPISSHQLEELWYRQKIEICPLIDIYV
ncbi:MAG: hypothetical protein GTN81_04770 [Proteobacteria bacterium]|nr:hypothetical protein [Pseudomonadota bacterium]